jgi:DNA-binding NtrC family response regulator
MRGDEVLIVDGHATDREGMKKLFEADGYVVAGVENSRAARELLASKFYPVLVLDTEIEPDSVLEMIDWVRDTSPKTGVLVLSNRRPFEVAVEAFRRGVVDVILKKPDQGPYLRERLAAASDRYRVEAQGGGSDLVREAREVLEEALRRLTEMARKVPATASVLTEIADVTTTIMLVDDDPALAPALTDTLKHGFDIVPVGSGGAGLDQATTQKRYDVVAAKDALPDLPGSMVVKSLQKHNPDVPAVVYEGPGVGGRLDVYEQGKRQESHPFGRLEDLAELVRVLAASAQETRRERRFLQAFRSQESAFLRRYAELKKKIDRF